MYTYLEGEREPDSIKAIGLQEVEVLSSGNLPQAFRVAVLGLETKPVYWLKEKG